jgi:hypothetical protein
MIYSIDSALSIPYQIPYIENLDCYFYDKEFISIFPSEQIVQLIYIQDEMYPHQFGKEISVKILGQGQQRVFTKKGKFILSIDGKFGNDRLFDSWNDSSNQLANFIKSNNFICPINIFGYFLNSQFHIIDMKLNEKNSEFVTQWIINHISNAAGISCDPIFEGHFNKNQVEQIIKDFGKEVIIKTQFERTSQLGRSIFKYKGANL